MITVVTPGAQTLVQDGGRAGLASRGVPSSGAFDRLALQLGNVAVGNQVAAPPQTIGNAGAAGLEILLRGPSLRFERPATCCVTGADIDIEVDGASMSMWTAFEVPANGVLKLGNVRGGARAYLTVAGGIDVPPFLDSRATCLLGSFGGLEGRALRAGDVLAVGEGGHGAARAGERTIPEDLRPRRHDADLTELRVVLGPQDGLFEPESVEDFLSRDWVLSPLANRVGCRFQDADLRFRERSDHLSADAGGDPSNIVDDAIPAGGIQVPSGTALVVLGPDGMTAGGYAKIATVISRDMWRLGQMRPGDKARFIDVSPSNAAAVVDREYSEVLAAAAQAVELSLASGG